MTITGVIAIPINNNVYAQAQKDAVEWIKQGRQLWQRNDISGAIAA
ncbi:MAG: hypothetical protein ACK451_13160 [Pseudanabaena sp.]